MEDGIQDMEDGIIDPAFMPMFRHIKALTDLDETSFTDELERFRLYLDEMTVEMPIEMDIEVDDDGGIHLGLTPPIYYASTSLQPVYHRMAITIKGERRG